MDHFEPTISGFYQFKYITDDLEFKIGNWIMLFMTKNHTEGDEVSMVNENDENYTHDFGRKAKKLNQKLKKYYFKNLM